MARDLPDDLEHDHISNYEVSDDYAEKYLMGVADARTPAEKRITALEARVAELTSAARELLEATDTLAIAAARRHLRRTLAAEKGETT